MQKIFSFIKRELFSVTTLLFVVVPFLMSMNNPQTGGNLLNSMTNSVQTTISKSIPVSSLKADFKRTAKKQGVSLGHFVNSHAKKTSFGGRKSTRSSLVAGHKPIYLPRAS